MQPQSKSVFTSLTIWGYAILALSHFIYNRTGVKVDDQVGPIQQAIQEIVNAMPPIVIGFGHLIASAMILIGRARATQPLHVFAPSATRPEPMTSPLKVLAFALVCVGALGLGGCATTSPSPSPSPVPAPTSNTDAAIESALPLIRTGAAVASGAVLDFAVQQPTTRTRLANEMYSSANAIYTLTGGALPTVAQFSSTLVAWGQPGDVQYAGYTSALSALYASYYPKLVASQNAKTASDLLNALAEGIEDATQSYVAVPAPAASTASL